MPDQGEPKKRKGFFSSLLGGLGRKDEEAPPAEEALLAEAADAAAVLEEAPESGGMDAMAALFAEPEALAEQRVPGREKPDDENVRHAQGHPLYTLLMRSQGGAPIEDPDITFNLSLFMDGGIEPDSEIRGWLGNLESDARQLLDRMNAEMDLEGDNTAAVKQDAQVVVRVRSDKMEAYVFVLPPTMDGETVTLEGLQGALEKAGVTFGIDEEELSDIATGQRTMRLYRIAQGEVAIDGENGEVIDRYKREFEIRLKVREDNTIDYKDLGWLQTVQPEGIICTIIPPTPAVPGHNVLGGEIRGKSGQKPNVPKGPGTYVDEEGTALLSKIEGVVSFEGSRFRVDPLLIIQGNVETATGNINMNGSILIHGDILEGFTVEATGDITVQGMIEGAQVLAGRDVQVGRGMNGNSHGVLQAKGEVRSKFIENATVTAGGKVVCDTIINSTVSSDTMIEVTTGRGAIIGGSITALERIEAQSIGNQSNRNIVVNMGTTANLLRDKHDLEQQVQVLKTEVEETEKNISFLDAGVNSATPELQQMSDDLKLKLSVLRMQLANTQRNLELMNKKQTDNDKCRLRANVIYPPVQVTIGSVNKTLRQMYFNATVYLKRGDIDVAII